jgi:ATP-dependent DNA helicase RecQ
LSDDERYPADDEEAEFRSFVRHLEGELREFDDALFARCADAVRDVGTVHGSSVLDVAVLIRQVIRRASERDGVPYQLPVSRSLGPTESDWEEVGVAPLPMGEAVLLQAEPWAPSWLADSSGPVDASAVAGTAAGLRARYEAFIADPSFEEATGYGTYQTSGQRAATRAALSMPESGTLIALLPTGSGKTEIAVTLGHLARRQTSIIVVPTVALAHDFERRFREVYARNPRIRAAELSFAWTADTDSAERDAFRSALIAGKLPFLVTSPESMAGALLNALRAAAEGGRIRSLVIDEAHLVTQWGRDFRPEFRQLANLRRELLERNMAAGHGGFRTLLLSATLGRVELEDLTELFGEPGPVSLVAANALRPEPEYWVAEPMYDDERRLRVVEAVKQLPRPLLLYVTSPDAAERWVMDLRVEGFNRLATVTGRTAGQDRRDVLDCLRAGRGRRSEYDLVVATSAFGLGIDNDQIRTVVHACLPETVDRWYQEVGRAGRDGHASTAVLVPAWGDDDEAASLGVKMLKPDNALRHWRALWAGRVNKQGLTTGAVKECGLSGS